MTKNAYASHGTHYLPPGLPAPNTEDPLVAPYYAALGRNELVVQRCASCRRWQWGPEWACQHCHSFELTWEEVEPRGTIYSWERVWHPVHPRLATHGPYVIVLVELPAAGSIRLLGNLLGDPRDEVHIGAAVEGRFERHVVEDCAYTLLHWERI